MAGLEVLDGIGDDGNRAEELVCPDYDRARFRPMRYCRHYREHSSGRDASGAVIEPSER